MCDKYRKQVSQATKESPSWFGQLVYSVNRFLDHKGVPISRENAKFVVQNAEAANENRIFSSTAHRREAFHWLAEYRIPKSIDLRSPLTSIDPHWFARGFVLNSAGSLWNTLDPASEGSQFADVGSDPGMDTYNLFKRADANTILQATGSRISPAEKFSEE